MEILLHGKPIDRDLLKSGLLYGLAGTLKERRDRSRDLFLAAVQNLESMIAQRRHQLHRDDDEFVEMLGLAAEAAKNMRLRVVKDEAAYRDWESGKTLQIVEDRAPK